MKVCKLVRLTQKDKNGDYKKDLQTAKVERERVVVSEKSVKDSELTSKSSGLLYVVDKEATAERDKVKGSKDSKNSGNDTPETVEFKGKKLTEKEIDQYAEENNIDLGKASTLNGKLAKIEKATEKK